MANNDRKNKLLANLRPLGTALPEGEDIVVYAPNLSWEQRTTAFNNAKQRLKQDPVDVNITLFDLNPTHEHTLDNIPVWNLTKVITILFELRKPGLDLIIMADDGRLFTMGVPVAPTEGRGRYPIHVKYSTNMGTHENYIYADTTGEIFAFLKEKFPKLSSWLPATGGKRKSRTRRHKKQYRKKTRSAK